LKNLVLDRIPRGCHGRPEDVVNAAVYLASGESARVSGAHLVVDGGGSVLG
jgi:meso-butanediol dehydrogenase/(S,S)-butanediol dehydrogenase/diacetyl reductase